MIARIDALPGVTAGAGAPLPLSGSDGLLRFGLQIEWKPRAPGDRADRAYLKWATPGYFRAMGIPLVRGRTFSPSDDADAVPVAVVDEALALQHFPGQDAIGERVKTSNDRRPRSSSSRSPSGLRRCSPATCPPGAP